MKESNILLDAKIDIKIQRGLKVLQFATEYNLLKSYYRNCPLNAYHETQEILSSKAKNAQIIKWKEAADLNAEIMCELNEQLLNNQQQDNGHQPSNHKSNKIMAVLQPKSQIIFQNQKSLSKQQSIKEDDPSQVSLQSVSNYISQKSMVKVSKLQSIKQQKQPSQEQSLINVPGSVISKKSKKPKIQSIDQSKISAISSKSQKQGSNDASISSKQVSKVSKSINESHKSNKQPKSSLLNNNISNITSLEPLIGQKQSSKSNLVEFDLLRQLSQSFVDEQNMKMLLKLQNCELQQKYLQQRIVNRLEKGYKNVNRIYDISWESLKLPRMDYAFKRPNYAHTID